MDAPQAPAKNPGQPAGVNPQGLKDLWEYNLTNHKPTAEGIRRIEALRSAAKAMANAIVDLVPAGRDQAMALSANEELLFHANAGVARAFNEDLGADNERAESTDAQQGESTDKAEPDTASTDSESTEDQASEETR